MQFPQNSVSLTKFLQSKGVLNQTQEIRKITQFPYGQSNPTYLIELSDASKLVLRRKPDGKLLHGAHQIEREYQITLSLSQVGFPVAKPYVLCEDPSVIGTPFFVMQYIEGRIFKDIKLMDQTAETKQQILFEMARVLALLHSQDVVKLKLDGLGKSVGFYERQISTWSRQYKLAETKRVSAMEDLMLWLSLNIPKDDKDDVVCLCHGDFSLSNVIFHPTENRILAVLDWELSTIGKSYADIAYMTQFYHVRSHEGAVVGGIKGIKPNYIGLPLEQDVVKQYFKERGLDKSQDLYFFIVFSMFRLASIAQGVYKRSQQGNASQQTGVQLGEVGWKLAEDAWELTKSRTMNDPFNVRDKLAVDAGVWANWPVSDRCKYYYYEVKKFLIKEYFPVERQILEVLQRQSNKEDRWQPIKLVEQLKEKAKSLGLWNLFCTSLVYGKGLTHLEYALICELMGLSFFAPEVFNCSAPDTGNMETLMLYANEEQKQKYLIPLMAGEIRSCFAMTEPAVASSDATNIQCTIQSNPNGYLINGRKWWISGAGDPRCKIAIVMGKTSQDSSKPYRQQSMVIVDLPHPQVNIIRPMQVFGFDDAPHGHMEIEFKNVQVPAKNMIWEEGRGFEIAQGRLGGGRLHHCMRLVGLGQRMIDLAIQRSENRVIFKQKMKDNQAFQQKLGYMVMNLSAARLMVLSASSMLDLHGNKASAALKALSECKAYVPKVICDIIDDTLQIFGGEGFSQDQIISYAYVQARTLRMADGPDEVHLRQISKFGVHQHHKSDLPKKAGYGLYKL